MSSVHHYIAMLNTRVIDTITQFSSMDEELLLGTYK